MKLLFHLIKPEITIMIHPKVFLIILVLLPLVLSCNDNSNQPSNQKGLIVKDGLLYTDSLSNIPFTGKYISEYKNKKIEFEVENGVKKGLFKLYFENGKLEIEGRLANNKNNGEWKYYYPEGILQSKGNFKNDTLTGKWFWFHKNGQISESGVFRNGFREGEWQSFDTNGVVQFTRIYSNGIEIDSIKH